VAGLGPCAQGKWRTYLDSGYYSDQLERFLGYFSRDQLLVIAFEELARCPSETMRAVFRFLAVDDTPCKAIDFRRLNRSLPGMWEHISDATWCWLIEHYRSHNRRLEELLGRSFESWNKATRPVG